MLTMLTMILALGDCNANGRMSLQAFQGILACLAGPELLMVDSCGCADLDGDGDSDLVDLASFQVRFGEDPCGSVTGRCLASHDTPGCDDAACCADVCAADPFCCHGTWDAVCVRTAMGRCGVPQPPVNDSCNAATVVTDGTTAFSTVGGTSGGPNEAVRCDDLELHADVWFRYEATCTGQAIVSLCGSEYDTTLAIYNGSICPAVPRAVQCSDDNCRDLESRTIVPVEHGQTYLVRVGGYDEEETGAGLLSIRCTSDGSNGDVCRASGGDCDSPHRAPGCADAEYCEEHCDVYPACCDVSWQGCAAEPPLPSGPCGPDSVPQCIDKVQGQYCPLGTRSGLCVSAPNCICLTNCGSRGCR